MAHWAHKLKIKDLIDHEAEDNSAHALQVAPIASARIEAFMKTCRRLDEDAKEDLENASWLFEEVAKVAENERVEAFDEALSALYDAGDSHRIWIA